MKREEREEFAKDILQGLSQSPKRLYSKYFYDERGDALFQEIMKLEEYYLTRSEYEIFSQQTEKIIQSLAPSQEPIQLIEFGAGDGLKTKLLLDQLLELEMDFEYIPIDISKNVLEELERDLAANMPKVKVKPLVGTYFSALEKIQGEQKKVILFLGSNIGNFTSQEAIQFLGNLGRILSTGDSLLMGVDLKKHPQIILDAYNDKHGVTKAFNLNLLKRINSTFDGNFDCSAFDHYPTYHPETGETKSFLVSQKKCQIHLKDLDFQFGLEWGEPLFMEVSKKYSLDELKELAAQTKFVVQEQFFDCKRYFVDVVFKKPKHESHLE